MSPHHEHKQPSHKLQEVFCRELPSRFCKNQICIKPPTLDRANFDRKSMISIATEHHSVNLSKRDNKSVDGYSMLLKSLPSLAASSKTEHTGQHKEQQKGDITAANNDESYTCICQSVLSLKPNMYGLDTIEVFAVSHESQPAMVPSTKDSKPFHVKSTSETTICGVSLSDSIKDDVGSTIHDDNHSKALSYSLIVKTRYHFYQQRDRSIGELGITPQPNDGTKRKKSRLKSYIEVIPLTSSPEIVHLTELSISNRCGTEETSIPAVGIYVTNSDDNQLRLYIATQKSLHNKCADTKHPIDPPCFSFSSLSFEVNEVNPTYSNDDERAENPFIFFSSITALDTHHKFTIQKLSVALFDGTIRIMTFSLIQKSSSTHDCLCKMHSSTFIIDGPVSSLHFGMLDLTEICTQTGNDPMSSLFLVAGSLCGFACIFYEVQLSTASSKCDTEGFSCFGGPLALVDELYDPMHKNEDCVTAVHTCCSHNAKPMIAVGTQCGRILLFQRTADSKYAFDESSVLRQAGSYQNELVSKINETKEEKDAFQYEVEKLQKESEHMEVSMSELRNKVHCSGNDALLVEDDEEHSERLLMSKLELAENNVLEMQQQISNYLTKIVDLQSCLDDSVANLENAKNETINTLQLSIRKFYRYELVCQHKLPYPVQEIHFEFDRLLVFTRRSIHVFRKTLSGKTTIEDKLNLLEKNLSKLFDNTTQSNIQ